MVANKIDSHPKKRRYIIVIITILMAFTSSIILYNFAVDNIKQSKEDALSQSLSFEYDKIWDHLQNLIQLSNLNATQVANSIERDIKTSFDMDKLKTALDNNDQEYVKRLHNIFEKNTEGKYLNNINNNRNAFMVLSGSVQIQEDYTIDISDNKDLSFYENKDFAKYGKLSYNKELFDNALDKIKNHSGGIIAMEPENSSSSKNHIKLKEITFSNLKKVYTKEGIEGLRGYKFLVPVYITDTGDIFGQKDIKKGEPQTNHKFIVIQTFHLYDQLKSAHPTYEYKQYEKSVMQRYDRILDMLHVLGIAICAAVALSILYIFSLYNIIVDSTQQDENNTTE